MRKEELPKEDKILLEKYGENALEIPSEYWDKFKLFETIHKKYYDLFQNHYEDLKHYALMFRDVLLFENICLHDMAFFVYKKDEIIGFKQKLLKSNSLKSQVVQLYYIYEPLFQEFCYNFLRIEKWDRGSNRCVYNYNIYTQIKNAEFEERFCVNKLTDKQCQIIIENKNKIEYGKVSIYSDKFSFLKQDKFVENFYIPCFFSGLSQWEFLKKHLLNYIKEKFPTTNIDQIFNLHRQKVQRVHQIEGLDYFRNYIFYDGKDVEELKSRIPKYLVYPQKPLNMPSCRLPKESLEEYIKRREWECKVDLEKENQYREECSKIDVENEKIKKISKDILMQIDLLKKQKNRELHNEHFSIIRDIEKTLFNNQVWSFIYENLDTINNYLATIYNKYIKDYWIQDSDSCRAYFQSHSGYYGIVEKFIELEKTKTRYINSEEYFNYHNKPFKLDKYHINIWIRTVKRQIEQEEQLRRIEYEKQMEKYRFNIRNVHYRDKNIEFNHSDHTYMVNGITLDSVTTFINNVFPKFNSEYHAKRKAEQLGISTKEVLDMWEKKGTESRELGTEMHDKIENYYLGNDSKETDAYAMFKIFANKVELKPYRTEWSVYDWECKIAGTIDFVDYQNGEYIIYDWKRSNKIIENGIAIKTNKYGEKGNYPLEHLDNSPYYHYALQLSFYKYILEKNYGLKISDLRLGIFHPSYNKPYVLKMPYLEKEIKDIVNLRSEDILF